MKRYLRSLMKRANKNRLNTASRTSQPKEMPYNRNICGKVENILPFVIISAALLYRSRVNRPFIVFGSTTDRKGLIGLSGVSDRSLNISRRFLKRSLAARQPSRTIRSRY